MISYKPIAPSTERTTDEYLSLNGCGIEHLSVIDRGSMRRNGRVDYHILYIERGICYIDNGDKITKVGAGTIIMYRPGEPQSYSFRAADHSISHYIHFTGTGCAELLERLGIADIHVFNMGTSETYERISARMFNEYVMKSKYWESIAVGCLYELLSIIARKHSLRQDRINHESETRIGSACRKIYDNLQAPPSIAELAAECNVSVSRFSHLFTDIVGKSPGEFIISMRMNRACELLENTDFSIREIAELIGYTDQNYFSRLFKTRTGYSPRTFRRNCQ